MLSDAIYCVISFFALFFTIGLMPRESMYWLAAKIKLWRYTEQCQFDFFFIFLSFFRFFCLFLFVRFFSLVARRNRRYNDANTPLKGKSGVGSLLSSYRTVPQLQPSRDINDIMEERQKSGQERT
jgi:hypothetical protein